MAHHWETGFVANRPSWHRLERAVLKEPASGWDVARKIAGVTWEVDTEPVYAYDEETGVYTQVPGWQNIVRDDKSSLRERVLAIQPESYQVVKNEKFGEVIDAVLDVTKDEDPVEFEAVMSLYGGRQIVALAFFKEPLKLAWDPSKTYRYCGFSSRHDGQGGLRGIPTNVRIECANTMNLAEMIDGKRVGFTIRHTSNWEERVKEIARDMRAARGESEKWLEFAEQLALYKVGSRQRETYLKRFLPISDDMGKQQMTNTQISRDRIRQILESDTCREIAKTGYGLLMASTEWADHHRSFNSDDSYISRQLLQKQAPKARAASVLRSMARLKG